MAYDKLPSINNAHSSETRNIINELIKIFNSMGFTYNESLSKAESILKEAKKTNEMNKNVQSQLNKFISEFEEEGTTNAEVVQARGEHNVLNERLVATEDNINDAIVDFKTGSITRNRKPQKPMITLLDDDGHKDVYNIYYPIIKQHNAKLTSAIVTDRIDVNTNTMTTANIEEMKTSGKVEFVSHTATHQNLTGMSLSDAESELKRSKEYITSIGENDKAFVYPFGEAGLNDDIINLVQKYYNYAFVSDNKLIGDGPYSMYKASRVVFERSIDQLKGWIDLAADNNQWLVINVHAAYDTTTPEKFEEIITYAKSKSVEFVTLAEGMESFANVIESGSLDKEFSVVDAAGRTFGNITSGLKYERTLNVSINTPLNEFPKDKTSTIHIRSVDLSSTGFPTAGTLYTDRRSSFDFSRQILYVYGSPNFYIRYWNGSQSKWTDFSLIDLSSTTIKLGDNAITAQTTPYQMDELMKKNKFETVITLDNSQGFPLNTSGILVTDITRGEGRYWQEFYRSNTHLIYRRTYYQDQWKPWYQVQMTEI